MPKRLRWGETVSATRNELLSLPWCRVSSGVCPFASPLSSHKGLDGQPGFVDDDGSPAFLYEFFTPGQVCSRKTFSLPGSCR